ncbi:MAG: 3-dehydroquinate synthase [Myxococcales bacterium]|nr:3-dehydroquinate synthase [Myxococcales bacterium]
MGERRSARIRKRGKLLALDARVPGDDRSYPILIGAGGLERLGPELQKRAEVRTVALVSDENVEPLHGERARASLEEVGLQVITITIPAGEAHKSAPVLLDVIDRMLKGGLGRRDVVVALGGGVVGDLAGLAAALFMRGVAFVQCPTSLLAQVDASIGGKVAIDLPTGKNLIGAFHFPLAVLIDPEVLTTLDDRMFACGLAEMLKHGALFSADHFKQIVDAAEALYARDFEVLTPLLATSVGLKAACVGRDPWETGEAGKGRVLLNLGHTVGHAIEQASSFALAHGEAVALGLRAAARISEARGVAQPGLEDTMVAALTRLRLPTELDVWLVGERGEAVERALSVDKKRTASSLSFVALARLGEPTVLSLSRAEILSLLREGKRRPADAEDAEPPGDGAPSGDASEPANASDGQ